MLLPFNYTGKLGFVVTLTTDRRVSFSRDAFHVSYVMCTVSRVLCHVHCVTLCILMPTGPTVEVSEGLDEETKIIIGIVCGVAGLIIVVLIIMVITIWFRDRRRRGT